MILKLVRTPAIYLVGFMGTGKTTVGRLLADRLGWHFLDLDEEIEREQGRPIAEIFMTEGEERFRAIETAALRKHLRVVRSGRPVVMALGGGTFSRPENVNLLEDNGITIWLDCPLDVARRRVEKDSTRPLARDPERFAELYESRRSSYSAADYRIEFAGDNPDGAVEAICRLPIF